MSKKSRSDETMSAYDRAVEKYGNPVEALAEIAFDKDYPIDLRYRALSDFAKYGNAQVKAVEISGPDGGAIEVKHELKSKVMQALDALAQNKREGGE